MTAQIIDGKAFAAQYKQKLALQVAELKARGVTPGLAVILVGDDPASEVYVRNKGKAAEECGIHSLTERLSASTTQDYLLKRIHDLNNDPQVHAILVQLPLPPQIDASAVLDAIDPAKDVDGFHVVNAGRLATGQESLVPCTPQGCMLLLEEYYRHQASGIRHEDKLSSPLAGLHAVIVGCSNIVGKPMAQLLLKSGCTVTLCHSRTRDLPGMVAQADILVVAVGKPGLIHGSWLKPGAVVIDVGINRVILPDGKSALKGDVDFESAKAVAGAITPVPGGVGPMTIACLLGNTVKAATL